MTAGGGTSVVCALRAPDRQGGIQRQRSENGDHSGRIPAGRQPNRQWSHSASLKQVAGTGPLVLNLSIRSSGPVAFVGNNIIYRNRQSDISSAFTPSLVDDEIVMVETGFHDDPQSSIECANQIYTDFICTEKREAENIEISSSWVAWDHSNRILRCYRDQLGRTPLYYTYVANRYFVFASTMRTILFIIDKAIEPRLNRAHAIKFLLGRSSEAGQTFFQHINRLSAAHTLYVTGQGITTHRYWSTNYIRLNNTQIKDIATDLENYLFDQ